MTIRHGLYFLFIGTHTRDEMFAVEGPDPWVPVARILEDRLSGFDLTDPGNVGTAISIHDEDFSYLLPERRDGEFATISDLLAIYERKLEGFGDLSYEIQYRYGMLIGSIGNLMHKLHAEIIEERAAA